MQPDTIVPNPGNPQAFNRYSYVLNNGSYPDDPVPDVILSDETLRTDSYRFWIDRHSRPYAVSPVGAEYPISGPFGAHGSCPAYSAYVDTQGNPYYHQDW